jgi:hypothetical protein
MESGDREPRASLREISNGAANDLSFETDLAKLGIVFDIGQCWLHTGWFTGGPSRLLSGLLGKSQIRAIKRPLR